MTPLSVRAASRYSEAVAGQYQRINPTLRQPNEADQTSHSSSSPGWSARAGWFGRSRARGSAKAPTDGTVYTFKLRRISAWQDGQPVTSADVAFTVNSLSDPDFKGDPAVAEGWLA